MQQQNLHKQHRRESWLKEKFKQSWGLPTVSTPKMHSMKNSDKSITDSDTTGN